MPGHQKFNTLERFLVRCTYFPSGPYRTLWSEFDLTTWSEMESIVASQFVITFQFVINYYKLERICNAIASQFVINYYKLERKCIANACQFVIIYFKLGRSCSANACNCITYAFQFVIIYYKLKRCYKLGRNR